MLITHVFFDCPECGENHCEIFDEDADNGDAQCPTCKQWFFLSSPDLFIYEEEF
jgi:transcription elongation factor Elf1